MADYKDFENTLDITEHMYDFIPDVARRVIVKAVLDTSEEFKAKEKARKEAREKMSPDERAVDDMQNFFARMAP